MIIVYNEYLPATCPKGKTTSDNMHFGKVFAYI